MQLGSHTLVPTTFNKHLVARAHQKKGRKKALLAGLTLTSMVDMFSLLVIFLLQTFSTSPELIVVTNGVTLPSAHTGHEIKNAPLISISSNGVFLDQKRVGDTDALLKNPEPLMEKLEALRMGWVKTHPNDKFPGEINLQAHKDIPSTLISQFMGMLPSQNFGSIQLIVTSGGS
jgi:biopolymer transport protein ExbD